jgi:hypothetical protein
LWNAEAIAGIAGKYILAVNGLWGHGWDAQRQQCELIERTTDLKMPANATIATIPQRSVVVNIEYGSSTGLSCESWTGIVTLTNRSSLLSIDKMRILTFLHLRHRTGHSYRKGSPSATDKNADTVKRITDAGAVSKVSWEYVMHRSKWEIGILFKNILEGYMASWDRQAYNVVFFELLDLDGRVGHEYISAWRT